MLVYSYTIYLYVFILSYSIATKRYRIRVDISLKRKLRRNQELTCVSKLFSYSFIDKWVVLWCVLLFVAIPSIINVCNLFEILYRCEVFFPAFRSVSLIQVCGIIARESRVVLNGLFFQRTEEFFMSRYEVLKKFENFSQFVRLFELVLLKNEFWVLLSYVQNVPSLIGKNTAADSICWEQKYSCMHTAYSLNLKDDEFIWSNLEIGPAIRKFISLYEHCTWTSFSFKFY